MQISSSKHCAHMQACMRAHTLCNIRESILCLSCYMMVVGWCRAFNDEGRHGFNKVCLANSLESDTI